MAVVRIENLVKKFGSKIAVDNMSLQVQEGEIFGFLGPNGAGKSTTINSVCGLIKIDQGSITIDGIDIKSRSTEAKQRLGLVPQEIALFDTLTAGENVEFFAKLAGVKGKLLKERVEEALEFVGLSDKRRDIPKSFSGGMKRRLNIACAIAHHPKVIIMDEPTVGIDPQSRNHILDSVRQLNKMGSTIIYTSHYMEEVEAICARVGIIDHGRLIAIGTKEELRKLVSEDERIIIDTFNLSYNSVEEIKAVKGVKDAAFSDGTLELVTQNSQAVLQDILHTLSKYGARVKGVDMIEPDLETVFLALTGRKLRD